jgi:hypothetical protein
LGQTRHMDLHQWRSRCSRGDRWNSTRSCRRNRWATR